MNDTACARLRAYKEYRAYLQDRLDHYKVMYKENEYDESGIRRVYYFNKLVAYTDVLTVFDDMLPICLMADADNGQALVSFKDVYAILSRSYSDAMSLYGKSNGSYYKGFTDAIDIALATIKDAIHQLEPPETEKE